MPLSSRITRAKTWVRPSDEELEMRAKINHADEKKARDRRFEESLDVLEALEIAEEWDPIERKRRFRERVDPIFYNRRSPPPPMLVASGFEGPPPPLLVRDEELPPPPSLVRDREFPPPPLLERRNEFRPPTSLGYRNAMPPRSSMSRARRLPPVPVSRIRRTSMPGGGGFPLTVRSGKMLPTPISTVNPTYYPSNPGMDSFESFYNVQNPFPLEDILSTTSFPISFNRHLPGYPAIISFLGPVQARNNYSSFALNPIRNALPIGKGMVDPPIEDQMDVVMKLVDHAIESGVDGLIDVRIAVNLQGECVAIGQGVMLDRISMRGIEDGFANDDFVGREVTSSRSEIRTEMVTRRAIDDFDVGLADRERGFGGGARTSDPGVRLITEEGEFGSGMRGYGSDVGSMMGRRSMLGSEFEREELGFGRGRATSEVPLDYVY